MASRFLYSFFLCFFISNDSFSQFNLNSSLSFDGNNDWINVQSPLSGNVDYTLEAWFLSNNPSNCNEHVRLIGWNSDEMEIALCSNELRFYNGVSWVQTGTNVGDNQWHHVAVVRDDPVYSIYLDGALVATSTETSPRNLSGNFSIGSRKQNTPSEFWKGLIDEVRIWDIPRSQLDIQITKDRILQGNEPGLVGYWRFDDDSNTTTVEDLSPNNNDGVLNNFPANNIWRDGAPLRYVGIRNNYSLLFDGKNDWIETPSPLSGNSNYTIEAWFISQNPSDCSNGHTRIIGWNSYEMEIADCSNELRFYDGQSWIGTGINIADGQWHHVAVVRDHPTYTIYYDGLPVKTYQRGNTLNMTGAFSIGSARPAAGNTAEYWKGCIDEVRIWNTPRTAQEIADYKDYIIDKNTSGLVGYWRFDDGPGSSTLKDLTNNNDGFLKEMHIQSAWKSGAPLSTQNPQYAEVVKKLDGGYVINQYDKLYFVYEEEYNSSQVACRIYNSTNDEILNTQLSVNFGRNYLDLGVIPSFLFFDFFVMELENAKREKWYLRFR